MKLDTLLGDKPIYEGKQPVRASGEYHDEQKFYEMLADRGLPLPVTEYEFSCTDRKWRFDYCWPLHGVALEVHGGAAMSSIGAHSSAEGLRNDWAKRNQASIEGYRVLIVEPKDLDTTGTVDLVYAALNGGWEN